MAKFVQIQIDGSAPVRVTEDAFKTVWEPKGFAEVDPAAAFIQEVAGVLADDLPSKTRDELDRIAVDMGLDPSAASTKREVVTLIEGAADSQS